MKSSDVFAQVQLAQAFAIEELKRKLAPVGKFVADEMISKRVFTITFAGDKFPGIYTREGCTRSSIRNLSVLEHP